MAAASMQRNMLLLCMVISVNQLAGLKMHKLSRQKSAHLRGQHNSGKGRAITQHNNLQHTPRRMPNYTCAANTDGISRFYAHATAFHPTTRKVTSHTYQLMYGIFLDPLRQAPTPPKLFEIGLGCSFDHGPGASAMLWKSYLQGVNLWEADINADCVDRARKGAAVLSSGVGFVAGDQGQAAEVKRWVKVSGGSFDVVIDDGGHHSKQIQTSFDVLWPQVVPGGLYFIEDLTVSNSKQYSDPFVPSMVNVLKDWFEQIILFKDAKDSTDEVFQRPVRHSIPKDLSFIFCQSEACALGKSPTSSSNPRSMQQPFSCGSTAKGVEEFYSIAQQLTPIPDKVTHHDYQLMYGIFLGPFRHAGASPKMLEIGLGCGMKYGAGASVDLWKKFLPNVNLWEAEYDAECVKVTKRNGLLDGINVVTGDQGNPEDVKRWVKETGGNFDFVVDDGGHTDRQQHTSFEILWPHVVPGGLYFIEDMQVSRSSLYSEKGVPHMADVVQDWVEQLVLKKGEKHRHKLPKDVSFIFCQAEACVIGKALEPRKGS